MQQDFSNGGRMRDQQRNRAYHGQVADEYELYQSFSEFSQTRSFVIPKELDVLHFSRRESTENDGYKFNYQVLVELQSRN